ncbi:sel1 repeat family protein [Rugamonas sp. CCM 8940]|nr:sel1 repeat family protein [Rugamonas sp. CCM 8940]
MLAILAAGSYFLIDYLQERALHALPYGYKKFNLSDPPPACGRWKAHMPATRDPATYRLYIEARNVWRSKIAWQFTHEEAMRILTDVRKAADLGDWGARALMSHFYLYGLGVLESNHVLDADPDKAVEIARMAAKELQPWGVYDLGVAYEHGYGGAHYDVDLAWAYYLKAAELGSPEAQMTLASAYAHEGRLNDEETMVQCAYQQGHGAAAFALGVDRRVSKKFEDSAKYFQEGVKFGSEDCASALKQLFDTGYWVTTAEEDKPALAALGVRADLERSNRYSIIYDTLKINPDLKLGRLDKVLPLPPAKLPEWSGVDDAVEPESKGPPTY